MQELRVCQGDFSAATAAIPGQGKHLEVVLLQAGYVDFAEFARVKLGVHPPVVVQLLAVPKLGQLAILTAQGIRSIRGRQIIRIFDCLPE